MKLLYGVQGTGNGHISRARMMAKHFAARNVDVQYLFSGRSPEQYFDMDVFGDFQLRHGLTFATRDGRISTLQTLRESRPLQFIKDVRSLDLSDYDLVITDFEPVTAWAGRLQGKTVIGVGHQYAFGHPGVPEDGVDLRNRLIMKLFAPVKVGLGLHWHHFGGPIVPPIINPDEKRLAPASHTLVYLPFEDQQRVTALLQSFKDQHFIQYAPTLSDADHGNVSHRKTNLHGFKHDLCSARGVICNAGFELVSECLHMGIPVLAKPVAGQSEQLGNAASLRQLKLADTMADINREHIASWLRQPQSSAAQNYPDVAGAICEWLLSGQWHNRQTLVDALWQNEQNHALTADLSL
ncbi:MJ1255/VC2487 family glycosyltransferase [Spongiibacter marinus]|uniref:MJ1255/VC2487 family glycosyltransferase n=1 Tax=Spongiibacter marinus TaxID=354246 RepID=UPI003C557EB8